MMTFYAAAGSYHIREEDGKKMPYIMHLGKLQPVSVPEFYVWSMLLWEVMTYDELRRKFIDRLDRTELSLDTMENALNMLVKRKLILTGIGYTGLDAIYNMLSDVFIHPVRGLYGTRRLSNIAKLLKSKKITVCDAIYLLQPDRVSDGERRIMKLIRQTPLNVGELVRCFENGVKDVSTADKVIAAIYTDESDTQARINNASSQSDYRREVLEATANLYLTRQVILEHA